MLSDVRYTQTATSFDLYSRVSHVKISRPKAILWVGWVTGNKVFLLSGLMPT